MGEKGLEISAKLEANDLLAIKESANDKELNEVLFQTIQYLLRHAYDISCSLIGSCNEREKKKIFSSFGKQVAQKACDFYQASKEHLDPKVMNEETWRKLETAVREIEEVNSLMASLEKNNSELLKRTDELNEKNDIYEKLTKKISVLKEMEKRVTVDALNELKREEKELDLHLGENSNIVIKLKEYGITSVEEFLKEIEKRKSIVKSEIKWFDNVLKDIIGEQERRSESLN